MSLLESLVASTRSRLATLPSGVPTSKATSKAQSFGPGSTRASDAGFSEALKAPGLSVIGEVKRSSPSAGDICPGVDAVLVARDYESAGVAAISVLTEPTRFGGSFEDLRRVAESVEVPVLMKDFVIDPEQVRVAALLGARASLVIVCLLDDVQLGEVLCACDTYGIDGLVECRDEVEVVRALEAGAQVIGINNRDLETLEIDHRRAEVLLPSIPAGIRRVAESGYTTATSTKNIGHVADAVLVGSALMRSADPKAHIEEIRACT